VKLKVTAYAGIGVVLDLEIFWLSLCHSLLSKQLQSSCCFASLLYGVMPHVEAEDGTFVFCIAPFRDNSTLKRSE